MILRLLLLVATGGFMWAAHTFMPDDGEAGIGLTLALGFVLLAASFAGQLVNTIGLPKLTGYLALGVLAGPYGLALVTEEMVTGLGPVTGVAVSLIALTAGGELNFERMRPLARTIGWMTLIAVIGTALLLAGVVLALRPFLPFLESLSPVGAVAAALVLGVTTAAQSPAVVIAVRAETRADGPVMRTVLGVVVVADLVVIVLFAITSSAARAVFRGTADVAETAASVAWELFGSMGAGVLVGLVLWLYLSRVRASASLFVIALCIVIAEIGTRLHLDPLITALAAGVLVENASDKGHVLLDNIAAASLPLYLVFFAVAGASIHLDVLAVVGIPALILVGTRAFGFLAGTRIAARIAGSPPEVARFAGFGLLPQAGLAIALSLLFARTFPELGPDAAALTLGIVAINELGAPVFFRRALLRSGEGHAEPPPPIEDDAELDAAID